MEKVLNLRTIYDNLEVPEGFELSYAMTVCNYRVLEVALRILNGSAPDCGEMVYDFLTMFKYTAEKTDLDVNAFFEDLADVTSTFAIMAATDSSPEELCLAVGTDSDTEEHHSAQARFMIVLGAAMACGEKIEFLAKL